MPPDNALTFMQQVAPLAGNVTSITILLGMLYYFIKRDNCQTLHIESLATEALKREAMLSARISQLEDRYNAQAITVIQDNTKAIAENSAMLSEVRKAVGSRIQDKT